MGRGRGENEVGLDDVERYALGESLVELPAALTKKLRQEISTALYSPPISLGRLQSLLDHRGFARACAEENDPLLDSFCQQLALDALGRGGQTVLSGYLNSIVLALGGLCPYNELIVRQPGGAIYHLRAEPEAKETLCGQRCQQPAVRYAHGSFLRADDGRCEQCRRLIARKSGPVYEAAWEIERDALTYPQLDELQKQLGAQVQVVLARASGADAAMVRTHIKERVLASLCLTASETAVANLYRCDPAERFDWLLPLLGNEQPEIRKTNEQLRAAIESCYGPGETLSWPGAGEMGEIMRLAIDDSVIDTPVRARFLAELIARQWPQAADLAERKLGSLDQIPVRIRAYWREQHPALLQRT